MSSDPRRVLSFSPFEGPEPRERAVIQERRLAVLSPMLFLILWEAVGRLGWIDARFFPTPAAIAGTFARMVVSGELIRHLAASTLRIVVGFALGAIPALLFGILMSMIPLVRAALTPLFAATFPIPKIAILPLLLLIFGLGEASKIAVIAIAVFFLVLFNTIAGVLGIPQIYLDVAKDLGASRLQVFRTVALPGALPMIFTGFKIGGGVALLVITAAEFVGAQAGIGFLIWESWQTFSIERLFVGLVVISGLGYGVSFCLDELQRRWVPWQP